MIEDKILGQSFVLHDPFLLEGKSREPYFEELRKSELISNKSFSNRTKVRK